MKVAAAAKSLQSCPTLCHPIDGSQLGSSVPGILQARILEWVAISFCNAWKWKVKVKSLSHTRLLATPWTAAYQAPPSMGFSRQEYQSGVPLPSPTMKDTCLTKMEKALNLYTTLTERNHIHETLIMVHYYHFLLLAIIVNPFQCLTYKLKFIIPMDVGKGENMG